MSNVLLFSVSFTNMVPSSNPIFQAFFVKISAEEKTTFCQHCEHGKTIHNFQDLICQVYSFGREKVVNLHKF